MSSRIDWSKARSSKAIRESGSLSLTDEKDRRNGDAASRWLNQRSESGFPKKRSKKKGEKKPSYSTVPAGIRFHIYTDGGCEPNPGAGGWSFVVIEGGVEINNRNGGDIQTTNNIMEMTAVLAALEYANLSGLQPSETVIYSDSQYCVKGTNKWRHAWKRNGWKRQNDALANAGMWKAIAEAHDAFPCAVVWVRGHSGVPGNERADRLAAKGRAYAIDHRITALNDPEAKQGEAA